jgi:hypothetical protein
MKTYLVFAILAVLCLCQCQSSSAPISPQKLQALLPGKPWITKLKNGDITVVGTKTFHPDGTASGVIYMQENDGAMIHHSSFEFKSRWRVEGDLVITTDVVTNPPGELDSYEMRDRVLRISDRKADWIDLTNGHMRYKTTRAP